MAGDYSTTTHLRRAIARRFPRARRIYNRARAYAVHLYLKYGLRFRRIPKSTVATAAGIRRLLERRREPRLTVGVDITALWEPLTGIGWYLYRLLEQLKDRDDLRLRLYGPTSIWSPDIASPVQPLPEGRAIEYVQRTVPEDFAFPAGWLIRILRRCEPFLVAADGNEVLFAPNYFLTRRYRLASGARVPTIHDLGFVRVPWTLRQETLDELQERLEHQSFEATRVITVSAAVRDELAEEGLATKQRVHVVHHGPGQLADIEPSDLPAEVPPKFCLHVGTLEPRKNIELLIEAWGLARERDPECPPLVLCGRYGWKAARIQRAVESAVAEGWLVHLGYVEDTALAALYREASLVVFPSLYEGFGLPAVEALWARTPLICSDLPVLREVTDGAALFAPAEDPHAWAARIVQLLQNNKLRQELVERGIERTAELSWAAAAERTVAVWAEAAGRSREGTDA